MSIIETSKQRTKGKIMFYYKEQTIEGNRGWYVYEYGCENLWIMKFRSKKEVLEFIKNK